MALPILGAILWKGGELLWDWGSSAVAAAAEKTKQKVIQLAELLVDLAKAYAKTYLVFGKAGVIQQMIADGVSKLDNMLGRLTDGVLQIGSRDFEPMGNIFYWDRIFKTIKNVNQELAISGNFAKIIENRFVNMLPRAFDIGASAEDVADAYEDFIETFTGNKLLDEEDLYRLVEFRKVFGDGLEEVAATFANSGISIKRTSMDMQQLVKSSSKYGVSASKVLKTFKSNLSYLDKLSFKSGVKGLQDMARYATESKLSLQSAAGFAEQIWEGSIEGAIDTSAQMQIIGGQIAELGDPFELMYLSRNEPEKLQKKLKHITSTLAVFNRSLGEITINSAGMDQLRSLSKATGISLEELAQSAKNTQRQLQIKSLFSDSIRSAQDFDAIISKVAQSAEFDKVRNTWVIKTESGVKNINQLTLDDIQALEAITQDNSTDGTFKEIIHTNETMSESLQRLIDVFKIRLFAPDGYLEMDKSVKGFAANMKMIYEGGAFNSLKQLWSGLSKSTVDNLLNTLNFFSGGVGGVEGIFKSIEWGVDKLSYFIDSISGAISMGLGFLADAADTIGLENAGKLLRETQDWINKKMSNERSTSNGADFFKNYDKIPEIDRQRYQGQTVPMSPETLDILKRMQRDIYGGTQNGDKLIFEGQDKAIPLPDFLKENPELSLQSYKIDPEILKSIPTNGTILDNPSIIPTNSEKNVSVNGTVTVDFGTYGKEILSLDSLPKLKTDIINYLKQ